MSTDPDDYKRLLGIGAYNSAISDAMKLALEPAHLTVMREHQKSLTDTLRAMMRPSVTTLLQQDSMATFAAMTAATASAFTSPLREHTTAFAEVMKAATRTSSLSMLVAEKSSIVSSIAELLEPTYSSLFRDHQRSIADALKVTDWTDQLAFARTISRQFDLRLPTATMAAIAALQGVAPERLTVLPAGFELSAALGVAGMAPSGVVADVLRYYGEEAPTGSAFAGALGSAAMVDAGDDVSSDQAASFLQAFASTVIALLRNEADVIRRGGLISILAFAVALLATYFSYQQLVVAETAAKKPSAADEQIAEVIRETKSLRADLQQRQRNTAERDRRVRYVRARAPLRVEPHGQALLVRYVYPDQPLRVLDERGDWLNVEVFDYHSNGSVHGWIARRRVLVQPAE